MPPPPAKRRKTAAGSLPAGTRRATIQEEHQPGLSIELIAKVATFAQYDDGDVMNICLAVGPKDAAIVRYTCLRNNLGYLKHCLKEFTGGNSRIEFMKSNIFCWMAVNTDWRKLCTKERTEDDELSTAKYRNEEGEPIYRTDPLIIFNNPAVASEFYLIDVLKHLVEAVGIDVNSYKWNGFVTAKKTHLLVTTMKVAEAAENRSCFNYLTSLRDTNVTLRANVSPKTTDTSRKPVWCFAYESRCSCKTFRAVVEHPSFDADRPFELDLIGRLVAPLIFTFVQTMSDQSPEKRQKKLEKFKILLDVGADPGLSIDTNPSPLDSAKSFLRGAIVHRDESFNVEAGRKLIQLMEEKVTSGASPSSSMAVVL